MKITVYGAGYVGLVTGKCLAEVGNDVLCVDTDPAKVELLNSGGIPIYEPGLEELVKKNRKEHRLKFTTDIKKAVDHGLFQFIAVGTPPDEDGAADLRYVLQVAGSVGPGALYDRSRAAPVPRSVDDARQPWRWGRLSSGHGTVGRHVERTDGWTAGRRSGRRDSFLILFTGFRYEQAPNGRIYKGFQHPDRAQVALICLCLYGDVRGVR